MHIKNSSMKRKTITLIFLFLIIIIHSTCKPMQSADMILNNGKIITVDQKFSIAEAVAISNGKIVAVGTDQQMKSYTGSKTKTVDLKGKTVIPGLIDSHLHPESASLSELEEEIPDIHTLEQLLTWIKAQAEIKEDGQWIIIPKFFSTRLIELRQPTLSELDIAAPSNPVFLNGSFGGMLNSEALRLSGINKKTKHKGIIKEKITGLPTGFIRASAFNLINLPKQKVLSYLEKQDALKTMLHRYNHYGITSLFSGAGDFESIKMYYDMSEKGVLTARIYQNILLPTIGKITPESVKNELAKYKNSTGYGDEWVKIGSLKIFLDGGILTGTAFLREPWGKTAGEIYGFNDPSYKGVINYSREELLTIVSLANEYNWSFTAHITGGGAVDLLLDVYNEVNQVKSIKDRRFSIIHGNFFTTDAIKRMNELGVCANMQAAWFYKDADAMKYILGEDRIKTFHPYRSLIDGGVIINGGSDHMVKFDANTSINPYNPFLAMWSMITRCTERESVISANESITREEALKIYTINNAYASFEESIKGSIEPGKLADLAIISDDILSCPIDKIKDIESLITILGGKVVYGTIDEL
jgi:predicted amidohydrolase YtcJ